MRGVILFTVFLLSACAPQPTIEELEDQAMASGDWSAVERREEMYKRQRGESAQVCPIRHTKVCNQSGALDRCACVPPGH